MVNNNTNLKGETMTTGTKVKGTYFGSAFAGTVTGAWAWTDKTFDGDDSVFVELSSPIVVNGVERTLISWKPAKGNTLEAA